VAAPVFNNVNNIPVFVENGTPVVLDNDVTLIDPDGDPFDGTSLSIFHGGNGAVLGGSGTLAFNGANVEIGGVVIGTFTDDADSRDITFNASATNARVNSLLQQLTFANSSEGPPEIQDVAFNFFNGDGAFASLAVDIVPANDAPIINAAATAGYQAGSAGTPLSGTIDISDVDSPLIASATVHIANGIAGDILSANVGTSGIVASYDAVTRTLTLAGARNDEVGRRAACPLRLARRYA
jgi:hypothetical protein